MTYYIITNMSNKIKTKKSNDYNNELQNVFNLMSINGKYNIVGSASLKSIYYSSDYDLNEKDKINGSDGFTQVYNIFKKKFEMAKQNPNIYITDFKNGVDNKNEPIRWSYDDIMNKKDEFIKALKQKSKIKLDIIYLLNGVFVEISEVYFLDIDHHKTYDDNELDLENLKKQLIESMKECIQDGLYFKALKRLFSICNIENIPVSHLVDFFNGQYGILYKANSDLNILLTLIQNKFRTPPIDEIKNNLQIIKQTLSIQEKTKKDISTIIDDICKVKKLDQMYVYIEKLSTYISRVFNREAKIVFESYYDKLKIRIM